MKKIEKLVAKIGYNTAKKTVNSASAWHSHQVKEPAAARASLLKEASKYEARREERVDVQVHLPFLFVCILNIGMIE